jgi:hypothetical protein
MAVRYLQSGQADEAGFLLTGGQIDDGADSWWAGAQLCFARVALATALAATTVTAAIASDLQQDLEEIPAGSLKVLSTPDEDYWQNRTPPVPASIYQQLPYARLDPEELPAGSLAKFSTPDEDFWDNPLSPIATANYQKLPYQPEPEELPGGSLLKFSSPDEDYWGLGAGGWGLGKAPVVGPNPQSLAPSPQTLYLPDLSDDPAASLRGQPDEDYWQNPVAPIPASVCQKLPILPDLSDDPAASLRGQPDEDYWQNPVAPIPASVYQKLPILPDLSDDPTGSLHGQPDEDFWANPVAPVPPSIYQPLPIAASDPGDIVPSVAFQPDEDFWQSAVAPVPPCGPKPSGLPSGAFAQAGGGPPALYGQLPYLPDVSDDPAGSLLKFVPPDEDYWQNAAAPAPPTLYQGLPYASGETAEIPPQTVLPPEEDFWQNPIAPAPPAFYQRLPYMPDLSDDPAGSLAKFSSPDEDYPQIAQITQTAQNLVPAFADSGEAPGPAFQPDEDYWPPLAAATGGWQNPQIARITQTGWNVWPQPWTFESPEPAGSLWGQPDEDFWANPVAPVPPCGPKPSACLPYDSRRQGGGPPALYGQLPYLPEVSDEPAGSLYGQPDEDFWVNPVAPAPPRIYQQLPYLPDVSDEPGGSPHGVPEETEWQNWVAPSPSRPWQPLPYLPELSEDPAGSLRILAEETEWLNWVAPVAARVFQLLPYASGEAAEFLPAVVSEEDCWPPLAIATRGWQNPTIPAQAARTWMQPAVYGFDEFSSYWWTSRWAVRTHSAARKRASRSTARARTSRGISRQSLSSQSSVISSR